MFLNFIGSGSALNTALGNNSAFLKKAGVLALLDCGSTTFSRLQSMRLLDDAKHIYVLLTHRHPDHVSSLGDLIFYCHYILGNKISVLSPDMDSMKVLLDLMGVKRELYEAVKLHERFNIDTLGFEIKPVPVMHVEDMSCYGYKLSYEGKTVYYSGDASMLPEEILVELENNSLDYVYQDVCSYDYPGNPHMHFEKLAQQIKPEYRSRVCCMHLDEGIEAARLLQLGFGIAENYK